MERSTSKTHPCRVSPRSEYFLRPCRSARCASGVLALLVFAASGAAGAEKDIASVHEPSGALRSLVVHDDLEVTLFASEPMIVNPTSIDVDSRGRVWVCEVVNYRKSHRPEGDRVVIVEDSDGDGSADRSTVFYQGPDINGAQGICVFGSRAVVACSPNMLLLSDDDGDDRADRKETLFTGLGPEHDHSSHAAVFGPDGKLYWSFGNMGGRVLDKFGNQVVDLAGHPVVDGGKPYWGGMVFRSRLDGSAFEVLGHNFRNSYEVTVDSFGTLWQSDNDDDGHRAVRLNCVLEFGNFGFLDEVTGASWQSERTGMHREVPKRHWHQNDPGVIPNVVTMGSGAPAGICVYEGDLLPEVFQGQLVICDALDAVVGSYLVESEGAGYRARVVPILTGKKDSWFRPSDVCVAPDGSLLVADWYDPAVGGHNMSDPEHGRIFRVAPPGRSYRVPEFDFSTAGGSVEALKNPNREARYRARKALVELGSEATEALVELYRSKKPRCRARALWLLSQDGAQGREWVQRAASDADPDIRVTALRAARHSGMDLLKILKERLRDPSPAVRRECAIALRLDRSEEAAGLWAALAEKHEGSDRWYLEALGTGAEAQWDRFFDAWLGRVGGGWDSPAGRDIVWRSRAEKTPEYLARIITNAEVPLTELPRYFRAFDFLRGEKKTEALTQLAFGDSERNSRRFDFIQAESLLRLKGTDAVKDPRFEPALEALLDRVAGAARFVDLVVSFGYARRFPDLFELAIGSPDSQLAVEAARFLLEKRQLGLFEAAISSNDFPRAMQSLRVLGSAADVRAFDLLLETVQQEPGTLEIRRQATRSLGRTLKGAVRLVEMIEKDELDEHLHAAAALQLRRAPWREVKAQVARLLPPPVTRNETPVPPIAVLVGLRGSAESGRRVYEREEFCARCHVVGGMGKAVGPDLSEIGDKLDASALYESILYPSAGISHDYEAWVLSMNSGAVLTGLIVDETSEIVSIKAADAIIRTVKRLDVLSLTMESASLMPGDLQKQLTTAELVDLVAYLLTLRKVD